MLRPLSAESRHSLHNADTVPAQVCEFHNSSQKKIISAAQRYRVSYIIFSGGVIGK